MMNTATAKTQKTFSRALVYIALIGGIAALVGFQHAGRAPESDLSAAPAPAADYNTGPPNVPSRTDAPGTRPIQPDLTAAWHTGVKALDQAVSVSLTDVSVSDAITALARQTGLNLVCFDAAGTGRVALHLIRVPVWRAMQALAETCGCVWQRDGSLFLLRVATGAGPSQIGSGMESPPLSQTARAGQDHLQQLEEETRLDPDNPIVHWQYGLALADDAQFLDKPLRDRTLPELRRAVALMPNEPRYHFTLAYVLGRQGQYPESIVECQEALRLKPDYDQARYQLGMALCRSGHTAEGYAEWHTVVATGAPLWKAKAQRALTTGPVEIGYNAGQ